MTEEKLQGRLLYMEAKADDAAAKYQRLAQLYAEQQTLILALSQAVHELRLGICPPTHTSVTYMLKPAEELIEDEELTT